MYFYRSRIVTPPAGGATVNLELQAADWTVPERPSVCLSVCLSSFALLPSEDQESGGSCAHSTRPLVARGIATLNATLIDQVRRAPAWPDLCVT